MLTNECIDTVEMAFKRMDRENNHVFDPRRAFYRHFAQ